jgi:hypothetical protein
VGAPRMACNHTDEATLRCADPREAMGIYGLEPADFYRLLKSQICSRPRLSAIVTA